MSRVVGHIWRVEWPHYRKDDPPGRAVLIEVFKPCDDGSGGRKPDELSEFRIPEGYVVTVQNLREPVQPWSKERTANYRKKRLRNRLSNKYPLLVEQLYEDELAKNPAYYAGESETDDARDSLFEFQKEQYEKFMGRQ